MRGLLGQLVVETQQLGGSRVAGQQQPGIVVGRLVGLVGWRATVGRILAAVSASSQPSMRRVNMYPVGERSVVVDDAVRAAKTRRPAR